MRNDLENKLGKRLLGERSWKNPGPSRVDNRIGINPEPDVIWEPEVLIAQLDTHWEEQNRVESGTLKVKFKNCRA